MSAGKAIAQAGHAYLNSYLDCLNKNPKKIQKYIQDSLGTKVCLIANHLHELEQAYAEAKANKLPCSLIIDSGHIHLPDFDGSPVVTALGIGPCTREEVGKILKKFKLY